MKALLTLTTYIQTGTTKTFNAPRNAWLVGIDFAVQFDSVLDNEASYVCVSRRSNGGVLVDDTDGLIACVRATNNLVTSGMFQGSPNKWVRLPEPGIYLPSTVPLYVVSGGTGLMSSNVTIYLRPS